MQKGPKKDPFSMMDAEEKETFENSSEEELNNRIAQTAKDDAALMQAKKEDQHLAELRATLKEASKDYVEGHKANNQRIAYARALLAARGKDAGTASTTSRPESE